MNAPIDPDRRTTSQNTALGTPGQAARIKGFSAAVSPLVGMIFVAGFVCGAIFRPGFLQGWVAGLCLLLLAGGLYFAWKRAVIIFLRYEAGARGEEQVARVLEGLPENWRVFHNVSLGLKELDHVLVGAGQVFAIETVNWQGAVRVKAGKLMHDAHFYPGYDLQSLGQRGEALAALLDLEASSVTPMVCMVGGRFGDYPGKQEGVWLGEIQDLANFLFAEAEGSLSDAEMKAVVKHLIGEEA